MVLIALFVIFVAGITIYNLVNRKNHKEINIENNFFD